MAEKTDLQIVLEDKVARDIFYSYLKEIYAVENMEAIEILTNHDFSRNASMRLKFFFDFVKEGGQREINLPNGVNTNDPTKLKDSKVVEKILDKCYGNLDESWQGFNSVSQITDKKKRKIKQSLIDKVKVRIELAKLPGYKKPFYLGMGKGVFGGQLLEKIAEKYNTYYSKDVIDFILDKGYRTQFMLFLKKEFSEYNLLAYERIRKDNFSKKEVREKYLADFIGHNAKISGLNVSNKLNTINADDLEGADILKELKDSITVNLIDGWRRFIVRDENGKKVGKAFRNYANKLIKLDVE